MSNKKATKRALLTSILAICLCLVMLIGSTFAWFTDTASTNVNSIQSGTLDVELVKAEANQSNEYEPLGEKLYWTQKVTAEGEAEPVTENAKPLWEPGCKYNLESFRIKNNGNLALKYKVVISGIVGNAELLKAIDFTVTVDGTALEAKDGTSTVTTAADLNNFEGKLAAGATTGKITITGHMKEEAGNDYQDKSIDGITITVYATQDTVENDSYGNTYDENAAYKLTINTVATGNLNVTKEDSANAKVNEEQTISSGAVSVTYPNDTVLKNDVEVTGETDKKAEVTQSLVYVGDTAQGTGVAVGDDKTVAAYELTLPVDATNTTLVAVELDYVKNLSGVEVYHNGVKLATSAGDPAREYFTYDRDTGKLVMYVFHASPIDIVFDKIDNLPANAKVVKSVDELKAAGEEENSYILFGQDVDLTGTGGSEQVWIKKSGTVDFNGNTLKGTLTTGTYSALDPIIVNVTLRDTTGGDGYSIETAYRNENGAMMQHTAINVMKPTTTIESGKYAGTNAVITCQVQGVYAADGTLWKFNATNPQPLPTEFMTSLVVNGGQFDAKGGGVCLANIIGTAIINNGTFNVAGDGAFVYAASDSKQDTVTTINNGIFTAMDAAAVAFYFDGTSGKVIVNGGTFTAPALVGGAKGTLIINGGTFSVDPSAYVDTTTHTVTENNGTWTVTAK